jgi:uncharacterized protein with HEPN domain
MHPDARALLWDVQTAVTRVRRFVLGRSFDDYVADDLLRSAVERQLSIAGEALGRLSKLDPTIAARIDSLPRIVAFRNVLVHGYASVDDRIVWGVIETSVERLAADVVAVLEEGA